ncbi:response regulator [Oscillatoria sp. FACHB-1407]|uniref:hybrid sensor histidine kinase/response regulator n=1 Tax=Oscillatoria sp. FACHB-1407 TaxID=2692847 RepID=UPI001685E726|nr:hybrid sensor histidine kinase/response regulator [Oscillatoria sp. FACHB-1407]MBD2465082.1 response regulator [Oscillatoria sp. FACHB-1407]
MERCSIHVLLIEDNPGDARLLWELLLEVNSVKFELEQVDRLSQGIQRLQDNIFDVILLDLTLPDTQGFETFTKLHNCARNIPIVVITGLNDETIALSAVQEGAQDYLVKGQLTGDLLVRSIRYAIERKRTEHKIREQAALLDIATDAILVEDLHHEIVFWNKGAEQLYGWSAEEVLGKRTDALLYKQPTAQFREAQKILFQQGEWSGELQHISRRGKEIIVESRWTLMRDEDYKPKSILVVSTDVTERKTLESQFLRAQRMESLGTLASGLAHDLNNILTPILSTAQLLQMKFPKTDERNQQLLQMLEGNAKRGAMLVKQVLSFARGVEGERSILQLRHLIVEIQHIIGETFPKSIETKLKVAQDLWTITGNATQLHQVLMNLCINARDAMPNGGTLAIAAQNLFIDENYARMNLDAKVGHFIQITVSDTGSGIAPEVIDRIFEPFFTTKEFGKGTGLGLSTVIGIVKSHGGFVSVSSEQGKGTHFNLFFPAVVASEPWENKDSEVLIGNHELVLVVDDEAAICASNKALLEAYNYRVLTANSGIEAIVLYTEYQANISLVLVDIMMPSMDGALTIRALQKINPHINIVAISGLVSSSQIAAVANSGIQSFLPKPYTAKELVKAVSQGCRVHPP